MSVSRNRICRLKKFASYYFSFAKGHAIDTKYIQKQTIIAMTKSMMYFIKTKLKNISVRNLSHFISREQLYVRDLVQSALEVIGGPFLLPPTAGLSDEVLESSTEDDDFTDNNNYCTKSLFIQNCCEHGKESSRFSLVHIGKTLVF